MIFFKFAIFKCLVVLLLAFGANSTKNNVCKTYSDYKFIDKSENCWFNPDVGTTPKQLAKNHGLEFEEHSVLTPDGYYVTLFRVQDRFSSMKKQAILLQHGLISSGVGFMTSGNKSLAFYLARKGYDVWLSNHRGTNFSPKHRYLDMSDPKFWDFSFHEIALFDIPSSLEYITNITDYHKKIVYIGHSMGTTIAFIYPSMMPKHAETYLDGIIALSPVASFKYTKSPIRPLAPALNKVVNSLFLKNVVVVFPYPKQLTNMITSYCLRYPEILTCKDILVMLNGEEEGQALAEHLPLIVSYHPGRTSVKCLLHYLQIITSGRFQRFDYGYWYNYQRYSTLMPPVYNLANIRVPVHLFYGLNDALVAEKDVARIFNSLKIKEKSMNLVPKSRSLKYNHMDFLFGINVENFVYEPVLEIIQNTKTHKT